MSVYHFGLLLALSASLFAASASNEAHTVLLRLLFSWIPAIVLGVPAVIVVLRGVRAPTSRLLLYAIAALLVANAVSVATSVHPSVSFFGLLHRHEGLVTLLRLALLFCLAAAAFSDPKARFTLLRFMAVVGFLELVFVFWQLLPLDVGQVAFFSGRPYGTFGNPNQLGLALLVFAFFAALLAHDTAERFFWRIFGAVLIPLLALGIFFSSSRGALLGVAVAVCVYFVLERRLLAEKLKGNTARYGAVALAVVGVSLIGGAYVFSGTIYFSHLLELNTFHTRLFAWETGIRAFLERPIFGWGLEQFPVAFDRYYDAALWRGTGWFRDSYFDTSHNIFLDSAVEGGLVLLSAVILFWFAVFFVAFKLRRAIPSLWHGMNVFIAFFAANIIAMNFDFHSPSTYSFLFVAFALLYALACEAGAQKQNGIAVSNRAPHNKSPASGIVGVSPRLVSIGGYVAVFALTAAFVWYIFSPLLVASTAASIANSPGQQKTLHERFYLYTEAVEGAGQFSAYSSLLQAGKALEILLVRDPDFDAALLGGEAASLLEAAKIEIARSGSMWAFYYAGRASQARILSTGNADDLARADEMFIRAHEAAPKREEVLWATAEIKAAMGKTSEAENIYRDMVAYVPASGEAYMRLGLFLVGDSMERGVLVERRQEITEAFRTARIKGFGPETFSSALWFMDVAASRHHWEKSAQFWHEARMTCVDAFVDDDGICGLFAAHEDAAMKRASHLWK